MVSKKHRRSDPDSNDQPIDQSVTEHDALYEQLEERWPDERPSRKRARREARRQGRRKHGQVRVRAERLETPDVDRLSRALLAALRELGRAQAEAEARAQSRSGRAGALGDFDSKDSGKGEAS